MSLNISSAQVGTKNVPNTNISTFTITTPQNGDGFQVYVTSVLNNGENITIRPIGIRNIESLKNSKKIIAEKRLAVIHQGQNGLKLIVYRQILAKAPGKESKIFIDFNGEKSLVGSVEQVRIFENEEFDMLQEPYEEYCDVTTKKLVALMEKKNGVKANQ